MNLIQFRRFVIVPTLTKLASVANEPRLDCEAAVRLVHGTAVHESGLQALDQIGSGPELGPGIGVFQIEEPTARDVLKRLGEGAFAGEPTASKLFQVLGDMLAAWPAMAAQLATNLVFATAMARMVFWLVPEPLPMADDIEGLARYWKRWYNTNAGKGTAAQWMLHYETRVKPHEHLFD